MFSSLSLHLLQSISKLLALGTTTEASSSGSSSPTKLNHLQRSLTELNDYTVLYYTVLYCTVLYYTVLYCTILYCTVLYCTVLYHIACTCTGTCTLLHSIVLYCTILYVSYCMYCAVLLVHISKCRCTCIYCATYCTVLLLISILF